MIDLPAPRLPRALPGLLAIVLAGGCGLVGPAATSSGLKAAKLTITPVQAPDGAGERDLTLRLRVQPA